MFGVTLGSYQKIEDIYKVGLRTKSTLTGVAERLTAELNEDQYMKAMQQAVESAKRNGINNRQRAPSQ